VAQKLKLREGLHIVGANNRQYGTIERIDGDYAYVGGKRIPVAAFDRIENDRPYVGEAGYRYFDGAGVADAASDAADVEGKIRVPVIEERLNVEKRQVELGSVDIRKDVVTEQVNVPVELMHEEVHVNRVDVTDRPVATGDLADAFQDATIRVPVRGEEAIVTKAAFVTGEVVIDRYRTTETQTITDTIRKQHVEVEENYTRDRETFREHFTKNRGKSGKPPFEEAEPTYRTGYLAGLDETHANRRFEDVEPDLRRDWEASGSRGGASWEHLREEIRQGWDRARTR